MGGIGTSPKADAVSGPHVRHVRANVLHNADTLTSHERWQNAAFPAIVEGLADQFAAAFLNIDEVDTGGGHADDSLSGTGDRSGHFVNLQHFGAAIGMDTNGAYGHQSYLLRVVKSVAASLVAQASACAR